MREGIREKQNLEKCSALVLPLCWGIVPGSLRTESRDCPLILVDRRPQDGKMASARLVYMCVDVPGGNSRGPAGTERTRQNRAVAQGALGLKGLPFCKRRLSTPTPHPHSSPPLALDT